MTTTVLDIDLDWEARALAGAEAYAAGRSDDSVAAWADCGRLAQTLSADDPRRAASLNNLALACYQQGDRVGASKLFASAEQAWRTAAAWVAVMAVDGQGRSSLFHMVMAQKHKTDYAAFGRQRFQTLVAGAAAATGFNRALVVPTQALSEAEQVSLLAAVGARRQAFGDRNPEARRMTKELMRRFGLEGAEEPGSEAAPGQPSRSALQIWSDERPARMNDGRRLLAAVLLTVVLH